MTRTIDRAIEVEVSARTAYDTWAHFELFPHFMEGVEEVNQLDDRRIRWRASVWGRGEEWESRITEQIPGKRIAWQSTGGASNAGVVTFHRLSEGRARVMLQLTYDPESWVEKVGDLLGVFTRQVEAGLEGFKGFVEKHGDC